MQLLSTKSIRISTNFCIHFIYKIKRTMPAKFCLQNVYKRFSKYGVHFVYKHFVCILYTNLCRNVEHFVYKYFVYILHKFCIQKIQKRWDTFCYANILYVFCIHQSRSTKNVHHKHYLYNLYTKFIQNAYTNNCMQNGCLISTYFNPFV